jgi:hypothetical protein
VSGKKVTVVGGNMKKPWSCAATPLLDCYKDNL